MEDFNSMPYWLLFPTVYAWPSPRNVSTRKAALWLHTKISRIKRGKLLEKARNIKDVFTGKKIRTISYYICLEGSRRPCTKLWCKYIFAPILDSMKLGLLNQAPLNPRLGRKCIIPSLKPKGRQAVQTLREQSFQINGARLFNCT